MAGAADDTLRPPTPGELRRLLRQEGLRPRHGLSQNFLTDAEALDTIVAAADLRPGDRVVEIGPGLGVLTRRLLAAGCTVVAIEVDPHLIGYLQRELDDADSLTLLHADALAIDPATLYPGEPYAVVANIPYHITSPLLHQFLGSDPPPMRAVLLLQAEVADRIAAPPGGMSYLSVFVQDLAEVEVVARVPASAFEPPPDVDSAILRLVVRPSPVVSPGERETFHRVVQAGFRQRRKQIHNSLVRELPVDRDAVVGALANCSVTPDRRPQTLSVAEWACLAAALGSHLEPARA
ncbi:MAG: ribosomal RNA small subunit methyltransferase A [Chloroflexi bacterium]|nr:MAG: ribosomal RNA small subunit methyltransferase A [Chloroflexota bacterium]